MKVLFLDDDEFRHTMVQLDIKRLGAKLVAVRTATDALKRVEREKFDLILLDHDLDGQTYVPSGPGTGWEVAAAIPESQNADTPVVVHSLNELGARAMLDVLGPSAQWVPFPSLSGYLAGLRGGA